MDAVEILQSLRLLEATYARHQREYERLQSLVENVTEEYDKPQIQESKPHDKRYDQLIQASLRRDNSWKKLTDARKFCHEILDKFDDPLWAYILERRYLSVHIPSIREISAELYIHESTVHKITKKALALFEDYAGVAKDQKG